VLKNSGEKKNMWKY